MDKQIIQEIKENPENIFYSGYFLNKNQEQLQKWISQQFSSSSSIKSLKKKKQIQHILEQMAKYIDGSPAASFHFFVDADTNLFFELDNEKKNIIKRYLNKEEYCVEQLQKDYWIDLYFNEDFVNVYEPEQKKDSWVLQHYYFTKTKFEKRDRIPTDNRDYLQKFPPLFILKNNTKFPDWAKYDCMEYKSSSNIHIQLVETLQKYYQQKNEKYMEEQMVELQRNPDLFVFGNDVIRGIKDYGIKEVYCYEKYKCKIEGNMDASLLNFRWVLVEEPNGQLEQFRGIVGKKYF